MKKSPNTAWIYKLVLGTFILNQQRSGGLKSESTGSAPDHSGGEKPSSLSGGKDA